LSTGKNTSPIAMNIGELLSTHRGIFLSYIREVGP
ncbi:unnamed protein product, partial [Rotaria sp. Silwood2]